MLDPTKLLPSPPEGYHHPLSGSQMKRILECPGSVKAGEGVVKKTNAKAAFGILVHEYATQIYNASTYLLVNEPLDHAAWSTAKEYLEALEEIFADINVNARILEKRVWLHSIKTTKFDMLSGTVDAAGWIVFNRLKMVDLKTGFINVAVEDNPQLLFYALGLYDCLDEFTRSTLREVDIYIVQINNKVGCEVKKQTITIAELLEFREKLQAAVTRVEEHPDLLIAGEHCDTTYCPVALNCPAHRAWLAEGVGMDLHDLQPGDLLPAPSDLRRALNVIPAVKAWIKLVEEQGLEAELAEPGTLVDWKAVTSFGHRKWVDEEVIKTKAKALGILDKVIKTSLKSPAQVEEIDPTLVVEGTTFRPDNGTKLAKRKKEELDKIDNFLKGIDENDKY